MKVELNDELIMRMLERNDVDLDLEEVDEGMIEWLKSQRSSVFERLSDEDAEELFSHCPRFSECDGRKEFGRMGEKAARAYLERIGYELVDTNWTCRYGEADIIARDEDALVFIEVKTRSGMSTGLPEEAVTSEKRRKYERIATCYLSEGDFEGSFPVRFDVVGIVILGPHRAFLRHHRNAFAACCQQ